MKFVQRTGIALAASASTLLVPSLAFAEGMGGAEILIPKPAEFIPALIIFLVIYFLLSKFVWPIVIKTLDARESKIEESIEEADATKAQAAEIRDEADAIVAEARRQASEIVMEARSDAEKERSRIVALAHKEAEEIIVKAQDTAADEMKRAYASAADTVAKVSVSVAAKIVGDTLAQDEGKQRELIDKYLKEVGTIHG
ncbi:F0F1 ATP synthase subunit B [Collinsella provencensis]|uniref:F0F1 ATP synthase subunit B n=1 Tax=Collinsella provencensis TaxID=1937461 RepID=UPI000C85B924|nr:F0F1 ATP synthase subunit B [Collinsella provencensis]